MSGSALYASEYLNVVKIQPSFPIGKSFISVEESLAIQKISSGNNEVENEDKKTNEEFEDMEKQLILPFGKIIGPVKIVVEKINKRVGFYKYFLCTSDTEKTKLNLDNIYYVPSIVGEYPWKDYKQFCIDLFLTP